MMKCCKIFFYEFVGDWKPHYCSSKIKTVIRLGDDTSDGYLFQTVVIKWNSMSQVRTEKPLFSCCVTSILTVVGDIIKHGIDYFCTY